jgi:hypothetical protein
MINLVLFTSTKGHFGNKQIYQKTIQDLFNKIDSNIFFKLRSLKIKMSSISSSSFSTQNLRIGITLSLKRYDESIWTNGIKLNVKIFTKDAILSNILIFGENSNNISFDNISGSCKPIFFFVDFCNNDFKSIESL